ncbi:hypothetical protein [Kushneria phyllosphaerae]|uniref:Spore coat protein U domain-containing protein n=1 Tax=Kushneria phyllosphaerae TaxID=2100822 RepID=A0A2R8CJ62_9GAMM|nr:hypothetical protein [Kushneria phyllosphaerae]SPJ32926.1 hypothetical protein KSP9073_00928 [Kushneria phyllosphaerae]
MPSLSRFNLSYRGLVFTSLLMLPTVVLAGSGQVQVSMSVRAGCLIQTPSNQAPDLGYLCSPNAGDFRLSLDNGRHADGIQRHLSDGQSRVPYQLQVALDNGKWLTANHALSIHLPENAPQLILQALSLPASPLERDLSYRDTVLATFEY